MSIAIPQAVLGERFAEVLNGQRVLTAVFTTFSFDPGFFALHILPHLFDYPFSQIERVRRVQLEDQLQTMNAVAVYYDRSALAPDSIVSLHR